MSPSRFACSDRQPQRHLLLDGEHSWICLLHRSCLAISPVTGTQAPQALEVRIDLNARQPFEKSAFVLFAQRPNLAVRVTSRNARTRFRRVGCEQSSKGKIKSLATHGYDLIRQGPSSYFGAIRLLRGSHLVCACQYGSPDPTSVHSRQSISFQIPKPSSRIFSVVQDERPRNKGRLYVIRL